MSIEMARNALLWCTIINYGLLLWWFVLFALAHDSMQRFQNKWFPMSVEAFDMVHYAGMALFKIGIILFNLVPYIALRIVA
jgi:hypothetical protein